jgi:hypothetical protein
VAMGEILSYAGVTDALLARVRRALSPGGLFVFDVATPGRVGSAPAKSWFEGDGWLVCAEATEDDASLTRSIVSFREADGGWRRTDEVHRLSLYDPGAVVEQLTAAGFADAHVLEGGYGPELELPRGIAVLAARAPAR